MTPSLLTFSDLEGSKSWSLGFQCLISHKGAKLGRMLLLTTNRKPYMASSMTPSVLTLSDLEGSKSRTLGFQCLISHKGAELGPMSLLIYYSVYREANDIITFDLKCPWKVKVKVSQILSGRKFAWNRFTRSNITTLIWMSQKGSLLAGGFSAVPAVFLVCFVSRPSPAIH